MGDAMTVGKFSNAQYFLLLKKFALISQVEVRMRIRPALGGWTDHARRGSTSSTED